MSRAESDALRWTYRTQTALALWRGLYFTPGGAVSAGGTASVASSVASRCADLVNGLGHCGTCHTPRNRLVGNWSLVEVSLWLQTGVSARGVATGPMAQVVLHSTQYLSDDDRLATASRAKACLGLIRRWRVSAPSQCPNRTS